VPVAEFHEAVSQQIAGVATRQFAGLHQQLAADVAGVETRQLAGLHQQFGLAGQRFGRKTSASRWRR
jgi:hypothetical protein